MAQRVKHLPTMREAWVQSLGWEDLLEFTQIFVCFSIMVYQRTLNTVPCAIQKTLLFMNTHFNSYENVEAREPFKVLF